MESNKGRIVCETERLVLRTVTNDDFEKIYEMSQDQDVMRFVAGTKSMEETRNWVDWILSAYDSDGICFWLVELKDSHEFIGLVGLLAKEVAALDEIELAYRIKKEHWRNGYAKEAAQACERYAIEILGVQRLISLIHPENAASKQVANSLGMQLEKEVEYNGVLCQVFALDNTAARAI